MSSPELMRIDIERSQKRLQRDCKTMVKKKSPKKRKGKGEKRQGGVAEQPHHGPATMPGPNAYDATKYFITKEERRDLNLIDASPVKPTELPMG